MDNSEIIIFDLLVVGLAEFFRPDTQYQLPKYPYPDFLQRASNTLALKMTTFLYPRTLEGLLALLEKPLQTWYPLVIPKEFDSEYGLIYDRALSEEASQYFYEQLIKRGQLAEFASVKVQQIALENFQFLRLLDKLQQANEQDAERSQREYVLLRQFLITNPYTTLGQLRNTFSQTRYISIDDVGELYEDCKENESYWCCDRCGPLIKKHGHLRGIKPSVCNDHRKNLSHVRRISGKQGLRRLKFGIHWRVCLPGIPEIRLFHALEKLHKQQSEYLCEVQLWPGIDRYDLQLRFGDGSVWAVDIKDYRNPYDLALQLKPIFGEGDLHYNESFYVIPSHRLHQRQDYIEILREEATGLPKSTHLFSDTAFEERVSAKIMHLSKGK
ncbi:restriction endonuclease-related protein [Nostoc sp.]|uniref:restriction endonuclease-related protein n=1 Tax=Nostoc sp. TaxID=1180 RepID=UPI002FF84D9F